jgi:hypothetical protein
VGEVPVEVVEEVGIAAHTPADSCCLLKPAVLVQAAEAEAHTDCSLQRVCRTAHSTHWRRRRPEQSAAAEGEVDTDRMQPKHTGVAVDIDGSSAADSGRIDAGVAAGVEDAEARMMHTACDTEGAEVGAGHDERDAPIGAEVPSSDEGADVAADEWDDALVAGRDVEVAEEVDRMCDAALEGVADSRGQQGVAVEGRWL